MKGMSHSRRPAGRRNSPVATRLIAMAVMALALVAVPASQALLRHSKSRSHSSPATRLRVPALQSPGNGSSVQSLPTFSWGSVAKATAYQFQLSADRRFASVVESHLAKGAIETPNTAATIDKAVPDGTYYWRVRAISGTSNAGPWSRPRTLRKTWMSAPGALNPNASTVAWPGQPLVFHWSAVPYAVKYQLTVATDENLANQVLGTRQSPVTTEGTVYTPSTPLDRGVYYWTVTPIDAEGHKGAASERAQFTYTWPTGTATQVTDLNPDPRVFDPLFSWAPVPGAARYEVEVNSAKEFPLGSKWCCTGTTLGTSLAPTKVLANNRYYWRVRALDAKGNPGEWNEGPSFTKAFDSVMPSINELALRNTEGQTLGGTPASDTPIVTWQPVPGASHYEVQVAPYEVPFGCEWSIVSKYPRVFQSETATNAWTPMGDAALGDRNHIGPSAWPTAQHSEPFPLPRGVGFEADVTSGSPILANVKHVEGVLHVGEAVAGPGIPQGTTITAVAGSTLTVSANPTETTKEVPLRSGVRYCLRVLARSDDDAQGKQVISEWTQMNGSQQAGFAFLAPPPLGEPEGSFVTPTSAYLQPGGSITPRTPYFTWRPVPAAQGYYVVIARDAGFTEVADVGFTNVPAYAPALANRVPLSDETTNYYWAVIPCTEEDGGGVHDDVPQDNNPHAFGKESAAPTLLSPANREAVYAQPTFKWTAVENARNYRIQVSQDPSFGHPLEDATTDATAYTSSSTYPADAPLYWRVRANDWIGQGLTWSAQGEFVRRLPAPVPLGSSPAGGGEPIPVLSWSAVQGAVGYELHVDKVNGLSANLSFPAGAAAPVEWYGVGVWRWKVRANFPTTTGLTATSAYSEPAQAFVRTLNAPAARGTRSGQRIVISWSPVSAAKEYEVDLSSTDGFAHTIESRRTDNASWAPQMKFSPAQKRGPLFWRVAAIDGNGNAGSFASGGFRGARVSCARPSKKGHKPTGCKKKRASKKHR